VWRWDMMASGVRIHVETESAAPISVGGVTVTPRSQAVILSFPFGQLVWNRPTEVVIERNGRTERIRVVDISRTFQLGVYALVVALGVAIAMGFIRRARKGSVTLRPISEEVVDERHAE